MTRKYPRWSNPGEAILILLISAIWILLSRSEPGATTDGLIPNPQEGFLAPNFTLQNHAGENVRLSDFRGQPILLNFWTSWCLPCRTEMPAMQHNFETYQSEGFVILAVNVTDQDNKNDALAFVQEFDLEFPILFDVNGDVTRLYQIRAFPSSFFIDHRGIIREVVIGGPMTEALIQIRIEQLLADSPK